MIRALVVWLIVLVGCALAWLIVGTLGLALIDWLLS